MISRDCSIIAKSTPSNSLIHGDTHSYNISPLFDMNPLLVVTSASAPSSPTCTRHLEYGANHAASKKSVSIQSCLVDLS